MFTVKQLSRLAGVTPRTLHHYDEIGSLTGAFGTGAGKPSKVGGNGYRQYGDEAVLRLQQVLFYREHGLPLDDIKKIMGRRDFEALHALEGHKAARHQQSARIRRLIQTVDNTIDQLKGKNVMSEKSFFEGFSDEQQAEYEKEIMQKYDPTHVKAVSKKWKDYSGTEKQRIKGEGDVVYRAMANAISKGSASTEAQAAVERWRRHIENFWIPDDEQLVGLADLYNEDPRFKANFDKIDPRYAEFVREAVKHYVAAKKK